MICVVILISVFANKPFLTTQYLKKNILNKSKVRKSGLVALSGYTSARPEVRRTADVGAYSLFRSILLVLTNDFIITCVYGPTGSNGHERKDADAALRTIFVRMRRRECCMLGAPFCQPTVPLHELPSDRLMIHRQISAHERRKWTRSVQLRSGILEYLCTRQHYVRGRYCHQTSSLFTIIPKNIYTTGRQQKRKGETEKDKNYMKIYRREESSLY